MIKVAAAAAVAAIVGFSVYQHVDYNDKMEKFAREVSSQQVDNRMVATINCNHAVKMVREGSAEFQSEYETLSNEQRVRLWKLTNASLEAVEANTQLSYEDKKEYDLLRASRNFDKIMNAAGSAGLAKPFWKSNRVVAAEMSEAC